MPLTRSQTNACAIATFGTLLLLAPQARAQPAGDAEPAVPVDAEPKSTSFEPGAPAESEWPEGVSVRYSDRRKTKKDESESEPEPAATGVYSKSVKGKLWLEGFVGPSSHDLDRFGAQNVLFQISDLGFPKVKGPEFGAAFGGAIANQIFFIGAAYRQANYEYGGVESYKLMKVGLDLQAVITLVPYVHPLIRLDVGYARVFDGAFATVGLKTNGVFFTLGAGVRVPIIRWLSCFATFDWSYVTVYPKDGGGLSIDGQQLAGTFGLTLHFLRVKE